jgi:hypothetical protein
VLPALLKKLDINFTMDESEFRNGPEVENTEIEEEHEESPPPAPPPNA